MGFFFGVICNPSRVLPELPCTATHLYIMEHPALAEDVRLITRAEKRSRVFVACLTNIVPHCTLD